MSRNHLRDLAIALIIAGGMYFIDGIRAAITALAIGLFLIVLLLFNQTEDKGKSALAITASSLSVGFLGGLAGLVSLAAWYSALRVGWGAVALPFFYIGAHVVFKFGLRFVHPAVFRTQRFYTDREVLAFIYALPCALFTLSLPLGPALHSIVTGRFLSDPNLPSSGMPSPTQFFFIEAVLAILVALGFYGYGVSMVMEEAENVKPSTIDTVIVGTGSGLLVMALALFTHIGAGFNPAPHLINKQEIATCFLFNALLAGSVFNSYRLRRAYAA